VGFFFSMEEGDFVKLNSAFGRARRVLSWSSMASLLSGASREILKSAHNISYVKYQGVQKMYSFYPIVLMHIYDGRIIIIVVLMLNLYIYIKRNVCLFVCSLCIQSL
jgi:hypothetical protein